MNESSYNIHWTEDSDLLSAYALERLDERVRADLDAHLASCSACKNAVEHELRIAAGVKAYGRNAIKSRLRESLGARQASSIPLPRILSAAAVIVIIAGVGIYNNWFAGTQGLEIQQQEKSMTKEESIEKAQELDATRPDLPPESAIPAETKTGRSAAASTEPSTVIAPPAAKELRKKDTGEEAERQAEEWTGNEMFELEEARPADGGGAAVAGNWVQGNIYEQDAGTREEGIKSESTPRTLMAPQEKASRSAKSRPQPTAQIPVLLSQQPLQLAPHEHQQVLGSDNAIPALLTPSSEGLLLTLFLGEQLPHEILESADITWVRDDSLVVGLQGQRMGFRIPSDILGQQQTFQIPSRQR